MFLIKYGEGIYVDGEEINWIEIKPDNIKFTMKNDPDCEIYTVQDEYRDCFVNNLEVLNNSLNIEKEWYRIKSND